MVLSGRAEPAAVRKPGAPCLTLKKGERRLGSGDADDAGLLALVVGLRGARLSALRALLAEGRVLERGAEELRGAGRQHGWSRGQVRRLLALCELAKRWHVPADSAAPAVGSPREAMLQFQDLRASTRECFAVLVLNTKNQPLGREIVAVGGLNVAALQAREVFGPALKLGAAAVILAHNHPSGDPTPSPEDQAVTRHLVDAGRLLGIEVLDHLIIAAERFRSLREVGEFEW